MSTKRTLAVSFLTAGLTAGVLATAVGPAAAQGIPVGGQGNVYFLSGALNSTGIAQATYGFGDPGDEVYFGDWYGNGEDLPMVRRGNVFYVPDSDNKNITKSVFAYGDKGDTVLIGDWDGDKKDSIAIRRGNEYFVKNDTSKTGIADKVFNYGEASDKVLVGNWDGAGRNLNAPKDPASVQAGEDTDFTDAGEYAANDTDTLMVVRGTEFFVKNDLKTGVAEYSFFYGDPGDQVLVGDWASAAVAENPATTAIEAKPAQSSDGADQLAVRRGNMYYKSTELEAAYQAKANPKGAAPFAFGDPTDAVFVASLKSPALDADGKVIYNQLSVALSATGKLSTDGTAAGEIVYDKDGIPLLNGYTKDGSDTDTKADAGPAPAQNPATGVMLTAYDVKGNAVLVAPGAFFKTADGGYLFDKDGTPYLSKSGLAGTGTDASPATLAEIKTSFLAGNAATATGTDATLVFDKAGAKVYTKTPAGEIKGDGLGVRR